MTRRAALALAGLLVAAVSARPALAAPHADWTMFGWNVARTGAPTVAMGIAPADLQHLVRQQVRIDGTVDASAIYLHGATVMGAPHDAFFVTTTYGKTIAIDADKGTVLWEYTPPGYRSLAGSHQVTNATPVADPDRKAVYAASPDGMLQKLAVADGRVEWRTAITKYPLREKITSPLGFFKGRVIATTGGYNGDEPPYQGHVAILDAATGTLLHVWNALCSDRHELMDPRTCPASDAAIWGRAGAVIDPATGDLYVATGNGPWDGKTSFGDSVIQLDPDATQILGNYTPANTEELNRRDQDIGSSSPVLTGTPYLVQGGKDGVLRVIDWRRMQGATPHRGGAASRLETPGRGLIFSAQAVWRHGGRTWIFAADSFGTAALQLVGDTLERVWQNGNAGTSPVVADGMLFVYSPQGGLNIYDAASGRVLRNLESGTGHWNSPIVADGRIAVPEGNANARQTAGVLDIWRVQRP